MILIQRYIFLELFKLGALSAGFVVTGLYLERLLHMTQVMGGPQATSEQRFLMMVSLAPAFLEFAIPVSVFAGSLLAFYRFHTENEIAAMKSTGWSFSFLLRPALFFSALAFVLTAWVILVALPWGNATVHRTALEILGGSERFSIRPGVFFKEFEGVTLFFKKSTPEGGMHNILLSQQSSGGPRRVFIAREGVLVRGADAGTLILQLKAGEIHESQPGEALYNVSGFSTYTLSIPLPNYNSLMEDFEDHQGVIGNQERSVQQLLEVRRERLRIGKTVYHEEVELSRKFALIFSCLLFGLVGPALGVQGSRAGRYGVFILGGIILLFYFLSLLLLQDLGYRGHLNSWLTPWIPNFGLAVAGVFLFKRALREQPLNFMAEWKRRVRERLSE